MVKSNFISYTFQYPNGTQNGDCGIFKKCDFLYQLCSL